MSELMDWFFDPLWIYRLSGVGILLGAFYIAVYLHILGKGGHGLWWINHSNMILLLIYPLCWWTWGLWVIGMASYLDDVVQHWKQAHGYPEYKSWLHLNGWWYLQRPVFRLLGIDTG